MNLFLNIMSLERRPENIENVMARLGKNPDFIRVLSDSVGFTRDKLQKQTRRLEMVNSE